MYAACSSRADHPYTLKYMTVGSRTLLFLMENCVIYTSVALSDLYAESERKVFQDIKYRLASILHNVNTMVYFKFQLQLKFRHKNYCSVTVNCHTVYAK